MNCLVLLILDNYSPSRLLNVAKNDKKIQPEFQAIFLLASRCTRLSSLDLSFCTVRKKKHGAAFPRAGQPGLPPSPTAACRPFRQPGWWPHTCQVWTLAALLPVQKHLEMAFLCMISPAKISTRWNLHDHYQPRLPLSKTGITQCAGNNDVTKRSCSPFKNVKCTKI